MVFNWDINRLGCRLLSHFLELYKGFPYSVSWFGIFIFFMLVFLHWDFLSFHVFLSFFLRFCYKSKCIGSLLTWSYPWTWFYMNLSIESFFFTCIYFLILIFIWFLCKWIHTHMYLLVDSHIHLIRLEVSSCFLICLSAGSQCFGFGYIWSVSLPLVD